MLTWLRKLFGRPCPIRDLRREPPGTLNELLAYMDLDRRLVVVELRLEEARRWQDAVVRDSDTLKSTRDHEKVPHRIAALDQDIRFAELRNAGVSRLIGVYCTARERLQQFANSVQEWLAKNQSVVSTAEIDALRVLARGVDAEWNRAEQAWQEYDTEFAAQRAAQTEARSVAADSGSDRIVGTNKVQRLSSLEPPQAE